MSPTRGTFAAQRAKGGSHTVRHLATEALPHVIPTEAQRSGGILPPGPTLALRSRSYLRNEWESSNAEGRDVRGVAGITPPQARASPGQLPLAGARGIFAARAARGSRFDVFGSSVAGFCLAVGLLVRVVG